MTQPVYGIVSNFRDINMNTTQKSIVFDDSEGIVITHENLNNPIPNYYSYNRFRYWLTLNGKQISSSYLDKPMRGTYEAFVRARLKAKVRSLNFKIRNMETLKKEHDELVEALKRYEK